MFDPLGQIGVEQDVDAVVDLLLADHVHAERAAHAALRALGGDQIARGETAVSSPVMRSVSVPVTAPSPWLNEVSSVLKRSSPGPARLPRSGGSPVQGRPGRRGNS